MQPVILIAVVAQVIISRVNRVAGAIAGFLITLGILIWGLDAYNSGYVITLFGLELSLTIFLVACLVWFIFDALELRNALKAREEPAAPPPPAAPM